MIEYLKENRLLNIALLLFLFSSFGICLSIYRVIFSGSFMYLFLIWNLVLAFIPWLLSTFLLSKNKSIRGFKLSIMLITWLLFFPNCPYILTDLFHLHKATEMPMWYDLILILTYAFTALILGILSLLDIEKIALMNLRKPFATLLLIILLFVSSFGVYVGRYLRWNSWDVLTNPISIFHDIAVRIRFPQHHLQTWGVTIVLGVFLNLVFFSMKAMVRRF